MPSVSPEQKRTMAAIAHGWKPPEGSSVAKIPVSVAKEFNAADQEKAKSKARRRAMAETLSRG